MSNEWERARLGDLVETQKGYAFKSSWYCDAGRPIVKVSDFTEDSVDPSSLVCIPEKTAGEHRKYELKAGDVVVQTVGSWPTNPASVVGKCVRIPEAATAALLNQNAVKLAPSKVLDQRFLFYLLRNKDFKTYIVGTAQGAASQAAITLDAIRAYEFDLPPVSTQRRLTDILSAYDDLIENNQRRIKILEEMARSLYREWFVHFRFPGHDKVKMVSSPLGPIPQGWEVKRAPECLDINPRVLVLRDGDKPFVPMSCLANNSMLISGIEFRDGNSGAKFQNGDTLFARITPCLENGKTGFVQFLPDEKAIACGSTEFIVLRSRTLTPEFVYLLARSDEFRRVAIKSMTGATGRQRVQEQCFNQFQIAQPPSTLLERFSAIVAPNFRLIYKLHLQTLNLRRTRDLLLPRLLSGQIPLSC
ncbi:MAG: restriction endonuclease subunit S [Nitrospira sp.]|nr:restriction endonuclease subunit S [Nitrospira sp.]MDH5194217.1 restriction endonuclease subunit S [Nitrospira sp.]